MMLVSPFIIIPQRVSSHVRFAYPLTMSRIVHLTHPVLLSFTTVPINLSSKYCPNYTTGRLDHSRVFISVTKHSIKHRSVSLRKCQCCYYCQRVMTVVKTPAAPNPIHKVCSCVCEQAMKFLQQAVGLRGYAQRDPLAEYKLEGYNLFLEMMAQVFPLSFLSVFPPRSF
jgi:hypothetical protein